MAKRGIRGNTSNPFVLLLLFIVFAFSFLVAVALTVALYAPPVLLIGGICYNEFRRHPRITALTSDETAQLSNVEEELLNVRTRLVEIETEGSHLKQNIDGTYHRGSRLGVSLNN